MNFQLFKKLKDVLKSLGYGLLGDKIKNKNIEYMLFKGGGIMIEVKTTFTPLRMLLRRREPVELKLTLRNNGEKERKLTIRIEMPRQISFDKGGYRTAELTRVDSIKAGEVKSVYYNIYPKPSIQLEPQYINIIVQEHNTNYQFTENEYKANVELDVQE